MYVVGVLKETCMYLRDSFFLKVVLHYNLGDDNYHSVARPIADISIRLRVLPFIVER